MPLISEKHQAAFIRTVKTGSTAVNDALTDHYGFERIGRMHSTILPEEAQKYFIFATVRNPYTRAVSMWWFYTQRDDDRYGIRQRCPDPDNLEAYIVWMKDQEHHFFLSQTHFLRSLPKLDRVLQMESLEQDFNALPFIDTPASLQRVNTASARNYVMDEVHQHVRARKKRTKEYLTKGVIKAINDWAGKDFSNFGYKRLK